MKEYLHKFQPLMPTRSLHGLSLLNLICTTTNITRYSSKIYNYNVCMGL